MAILSSGHKIDNYTVKSVIKTNTYTETYRVEDNDGNPYFLKVCIIKKMPTKMLDSSTGTPYEIELCKILNHKNIISFITSGELDFVEGKVAYYITNYFNGEILHNKIHSTKLSETEAVAIYKSILEGLQHMHNIGLYHNDINPYNIMLSTTQGVETQIIDLGHISTRCDGKVRFDTSDLDMLYCANETFNGIYDERTDIFSATMTLYNMLTGELPWNMEISPINRTYSALRLKDLRKRNPLQIDSLNVSDVVKTILKEGLAVDYKERAISVDILLEYLNGTRQTATKETETPRTKTVDKQPKKKNDNQNNDEDPEQTEFVVKCGGGNGFADIAGMNDLKEYLSKKIIFVIKNKELAKQYRLTPPNAMLLYGPPGCGKTFVAEKFAEETKFNYILVKASDLASTFIHGSQQKINKLFTLAESKAPIVICFDEFDAFVPDRSQSATQYVAGEVNEFLTQLNNCSKRGIFVVATTNRPDKIDPAVLRTGRIDKQVYVPMPDNEARAEMFKLHLKGRPLDTTNLDYNKLAEITEGYIASDISYIVNDTAMVAAFNRQPISMEMLQKTISETNPSLRKDVLRQYEAMRERIESEQRKGTSQRRVGFFQ